MHRELRTDISELNPGIEWDYENIVVAVSAFMLLGNHDNFTDCLIATARLESYKALLDDALSDGIISFEEVKEIQCYCGDDGEPTDMIEGDLYNQGTRRIVIFQFDPLRLEIYFCGSQSDSPGAMQFVQIDVLFE
jgi:hypothetical protein